MQNFPAYKELTNLRFNTGSLYFPVLWLTWIFFLKETQWADDADPSYKVDAISGPDKSIAQLLGTGPNFGWESDFLFHLPRKM